MFKRKLILLFAVFALAASACATAEETADETIAPDAMEGSTLATVVERGELICGVSGTAVGMSELDPDGRMVGFDADYCRALAAAVLGDAEAVVFRPLTAAERWEALKNNAVDVLFRNSTWTQSRDTDISVQFAATTLFDGQMMMANPETMPHITPASGFEAIDGAIACVSLGTTSELNISEGALVAGVEITLEAVETAPEAMEKFKAGTCDIVTMDNSAIFGNRSAEIAAGTPGAENWVIFPSSPISKEPLGPVVRQGDDQWFDIVNWTVFATFIADEKGVTSANIDEKREMTPELTRLFGGEGEVQTAMGLEADAFYQVIKQVGNYGELFQRNLEGPLGIMREGSLNAQWFDGGLIYAPPAR